VANPANSVLSAKIKYFRKERSTTQEKPAIVVNGSWHLFVLLITNQMSNVNKSVL